MIPETEKRYVSYDAKNLLTCRKTDEHDGCEPAQTYMATPFHWEPKIFKERETIQKSARQEQLEAELKEERRKQLISWNKDKKAKQNIIGRVFARTKNPQEVTA
jgi:hypothetical protein